MLAEGRMPLNRAERKAVDKLLDGHDGTASLTRRDPGETGPLLVHIGDFVWQVSAAGRVTKAAN